MRRVILMALSVLAGAGCATTEDDGPKLRYPRSCVVTYVDFAAHVDCEFD